MIYLGIALVFILIAIVTYVRSQAIRATVNKGFSLTASSMPIVAVLFVFGFIFNMINMKLTPASLTANTPPSPLMIGTGFVFFLITIFIQAGSMGYLRDKIKQGSASFSNFNSAATKYYLKIFLLSLAVGLIIGSFVLIAALLLALLSQSAQMVAVVLAMVIAAIGIYTLFLLFFAPYIAICEEIPVIACLKQSVRVVRKNLLKVLGISLILISAGFIVGMTLGIGVGLLSRVLPVGTPQIIFIVLSSLINAFLGLFVTASFMNFYLGISATASAEVKS